jgi:hypothetical protein
MLRFTRPIALCVLVLAGTACATLMPGEDSRAVVDLSDADAREGDDDQVTRMASVACVPGQRVVVEAELTGNLVPPPADSLIGEALCDGKAVATTQVTAQPPLGFDANSDRGVQTTGPAACRASWAFMPNANKPAWKVKCTFH